MVICVIYLIFNILNNILFNDVIYVNRFSYIEKKSLGKYGKIPP